MIVNHSMSQSQPEIIDYFLPAGQTRVTDFFAAVPLTAAKRTRPLPATDEGLQDEDDGHGTEAPVPASTSEPQRDPDDPNFWFLYDGPAPDGWEKVEVIVSRMSCPKLIHYRRKPKLKRTLEEVYELIPRDHPYWFEDSQHENNCACEICKIVWEEARD